MTLDMYGCEMKMVRDRRLRAVCRYDAGPGLEHSWSSLGALHLKHGPYTMISPSWPRGQDAPGDHTSALCPTAPEAFKRPLHYWPADS